MDVSVMYMNVNNMLTSMNYKFTEQNSCVG